jgi:DNA-binding transcriptional MerR regulator
MSDDPPQRSAPARRRDRGPIGHDRQAGVGLLDQDLPIPGPRTKAALALLERHRRRGAQQLPRPKARARLITTPSPPAPKPPPRPPRPTCSTISEVSQQLGLTLRAIRLYEEMGLIACQRGDTNIRTLSHATKAKLKTIVELKQLGLTLSEIVRLLPDHGSASPELRARLEARLLSIAQQREAIVRYLSRLDAERP